jgi:hypothetical protein
MSARPVDLLRREVEQSAQRVCEECGHPHGWQVRLIDRLTFNNEILFDLAYNEQCLITAFNLPFDLGRLAVRSSDARGSDVAGGHSLELFTRRDSVPGRWTTEEDKQKPRVVVTSIDSERARFGFTQTRKGRAYVRGNWLDCRQIAFSLTDVAYTLAGACKEFGTVHQKLDPGGDHGVLTLEYVRYARRDLLATLELASKLLEEFDLHPISPVSADEAGVPDTSEIFLMSPASVTKGYLKAMGITPPLERWPVLVSKGQRWVLDAVLEAFFAGRSECRIRLNRVPTDYLDFTSLYPTL